MSFVDFIHTLWSASRWYSRQHMSSINRKKCCHVPSSLHFRISLYERISLRLNNMRTTAWKALTASSLRPYNKWTSHHKESYDQSSNENDNYTKQRPELHKCNVSNVVASKVLGDMTFTGLNFEKQLAKFKRNCKYLFVDLRYQSVLAFVFALLIDWQDSSRGITTYSTSMFPTIE